MKGIPRMKYSKLSYKEPDPKTITTIFATVYLLVMFVIYPFYMKEGYVDIGAHKFTFFLYTSLTGVFLILVVGLIPLIKSVKSFDLTDAFAMGFILVTIASILLSQYKKTSFLGEEGWFVGFLTIILCSFLYLVFSHLYIFNEIIVYIALSAAAVVYILGILDRFSLYVIPLEIRNPSFISTLGNINWFMGFYCIFSAIGTGMFLSELKRSSSEKITVKEFLLGAFTFIAFVTGFAQGSESVFLFDVALLLGVSFMGHLKEARSRDTFLLIAMWALGGYFVHVLRVLLPDGYNYELDGLCAVLTEKRFLITVFIFALVIWYLMNIKDKDIPFLPVLIIYIAGFIAWLTIGILKTKAGLFPNITNSVFIFDTSFGSGRGAAIKVAFEALKQMSIKDYIVGVGPDAFSSFIYNNDKLSELVYEFWPADTLTNSHCEPLTLLINEGILGVVGFYGTLTTYIIKAVKNKKSEGISFGLCVALAVWCYAIHNLISFTQILSTPFLFIFLGLGKAFFDKNTP